jgi:hypothetical protein
MLVGKRFETILTRNGTGPATGPVIHLLPSGPPAKTLGSGAVVSIRRPVLSVAARPAAAQAHAHAVDALRRPYAGVVAPVPAYEQRLPGDPPGRRRRAA